ncbi:MAG: hypothetical protein WAV01_02120 [Candidatus Saccharimonadales bacterium]
MTTEQQYKTITLRIPVDLLAVIDEMAIEAMRSRTAQIAYMLESYLRDKNDY